jgi:hypothetical protein
MDCSGLTSIIIPNSATTIGNWAFQYCSGLTSVTIGEKVKTIGNAAFYNCTGLMSVTIPNSVTSIGDEAFRSCSGLTSVTIGEKVKTIGNAAFKGCSSLTSIYVDAKNIHYSSIGGALFNKSQNTLIQYPEGKTGGYIIPNSVTTIENMAFENCGGLTSINIGNSVKTIGYYAFSNCTSLTSIILPNSVKTIREYAFNDCSGLTSITIPNSVTIIVIGVFSGCTGLTSVTIPNSITDIESFAFQNCSGLTSVTIPNSVTIIEYYAFHDCINLTEMYVKAQNPPATTGHDVFIGVSTTIPVHVPCGRADAYLNASTWNNFTNYIDDLPLVNISVESNNLAMGTANVIQANTCTDDMAIIGATANAGYHFVQWNDGNTDNPRTVTVTEDIVFTAEFKPGAVAVYPNPAVDNITVRLPENTHQAIFTLYDTQGRVLMHKHIGNGDDVSIDGLATGMYVYNMVTEKESYKGKVEIKK